MALANFLRSHIILIITAGILAHGVELRAQNVDPPDKIYSIQLGASLSPQAAETCKQQFEQLGCSPVFIEFQNPRYKVLFGCFEYYADAQLYRAWFRSSGKCPQAFTRSRAYEGPQDLNRVCVAPITRVFLLEQDSITECPNVQIDETQPPVPAIKALINAKNLDAAQVQLEQLVRDAPSTSPLAGWSRYHLGKIKRDKKLTDNALSLFKEVANGNVASRRLERILSMRHVGAIYHADKRDRLKALQTYSELDKFCTDNETHAWCKLQRASLIFELVRSERGSWNEARRACQQAVAQIPETIRTDRATADILYIETYFWEGNHQRVVELTPAFLQKYPDVKREYVSALCMMGISCYDLKRPEEAITLLLRIFQTGFTDAEGYRGIDLLPRSAFWLAAIYAELGDAVNRDLWLDWLKNNHPDSNITRAALDLLREGN